MSAVSKVKMKIYEPTLDPRVSDDAWRDPFPKRGYPGFETVCAARVRAYDRTYPTRGPESEIRVFSHRRFMTALTYYALALERDALDPSLTPPRDSGYIGVRSDGTFITATDTFTRADGPLYTSGTITGGGGGGGTFGISGGSGGYATTISPITTFTPDYATTISPTVTGTYTSPGYLTTPHGSLQTVLVDAHGEMVLDVSDFIERMEWETTMGPGAPKVRIWLRAGAVVRLHRDPKMLTFQDETEMDAIAIFDPDDYDPEDGSEL